MKNIELQEILKQYPDNVDVNIHVVGETSELSLVGLNVDYIYKDELILLTMDIKNADYS